MFYLATSHMYKAECSTIRQRLYSVSCPQSNNCHWPGQAVALSSCHCWLPDSHCISSATIVAAALASIFADTGLIQHLPLLALNQLPSGSALSSHTIAPQRLMASIADCRASFAAARASGPEPAPMPDMIITTADAVVPGLSAPLSIKQLTTARPWTEVTPALTLLHMPSGSGVNPEMERVYRDPGRLATGAGCGCMEGPCGPDGERLVEGGCRLGGEGPGEGGRLGNGGGSGGGGDGGAGGGGEHASNV